MSLSTPQIAAQVDAVLSRDPTAQAIAIRSPTRNEWPESLNQRGRSFSMRWCDSLLALREALNEIEDDAAPGAGLVVLTPLATTQVPEDVIARLARGRVFQPEGWDIVRQLFGAKETDARLGRYAWLPQVLIEGSAQGAYTPVANGFLDLETVWKELLSRLLRLPAARPDAVALLRWAMEPLTDASLNLLPTSARPDVMQWLGEASGIAGGMVLACIAAGHTGDAVALALVADVVFSAEGEGQPALAHAAIRLERFVGEAHVGVREGRAWADAAKQLVSEIGVDEMRASLDRADALLGELRISDFAQLSDLLPSALDQRLRAFAAAVTQHVQQPSVDTQDAVEAGAERVTAHRLASVQPQRSDRVEMARRLCRWLTDADSVAASKGSVTDWVSWQADQGSFVDWARFRLLGGDELPEVSQAYAALRAEVINRRNGFALPFSRMLQTWNAQATRSDGRVMPVESVLDQVLAPLAAHQPVLLLVVDGLSSSVFRELFARPERLGWAEMVPTDLVRAMSGVAAFPTVTEVSRTSLLCGRLVLGAAAQEKSGFASHSALLAKSNTNAPPKLFHKGELSESTNLSQAVRTAISNPQQKIVGVVYNAVDDHLSGPDQLHQRWNLEDLRLLLPLLREAREARRVVVITADHGHLLEDGTTQLPGGESDRWRTGTRSSDAREIVLQGGRVVTADASKSVVCLWGESSRYAGRKNGYHGGVSLQELTVPLNVLMPFGMTVPGWQPALPAPPEWWDAQVRGTATTPDHAPVAARPPHATARRASAPASTTQQPLFDLPEPVAIPAPPTSNIDWIDALLASAVYMSQRQLAARVAPPDDQMRKLLAALMERGGMLSRNALAQRLSMPEVRLNGLLSAVRRILNVDQSAVLQVDEPPGTLQLNRSLLLQQFRIETTGGFR